MKKRQSKKLTLAKETLSGLEKLAQGGVTGYPSSPHCQGSDPIVGCGGGGGGNTSAGLYMDPGTCTG